MSALPPKADILQHNRHRAGGLEHCHQRSARGQNDVWRRRRDFIKAVVGSAAAFPFAARAQQPDRIRHIGVLSGSAEDDQDTKIHLAVFVKELQQLGWTDGRNVRIDYRFVAGNPENYPKYAAELVALACAYFLGCD